MGARQRRAEAAARQDRGGAREGLRSRWRPRAQGPARRAGGPARADPAAGGRGGGAALPRQPGGALRRGEERVMGFSIRGKIKAKKEAERAKSSSDKFAVSPDKKKTDQVKTRS